MTKNTQIDFNVFCPLPWYTLTAQEDGKLGICPANILEDKQDVIGKISENKISDLWNSPKIKEIRKSMMEGKKHHFCKICYKKEGQGIKSVRQVSLERHKRMISKYFFQTQDNGVYKKFITQLDIRFSNVCNLACRMCGSRASTSRAKLDKQLSMKVYQGREGEYDDATNFWGDERLFSQLKKIQIAGGEPMLDKNFYKLLEFLVENKLCEKLDFQVFTNLTILPGINGYKGYLFGKYQDIFEIIGEFLQFTFLVSIDGFGDSCEKVRIGSDWDILLNNLEKLYQESRKRKNIRVFLKPTIQIDSVLDFPKLYIFGKERGFDIDIKPLSVPRYLSIINLPELEKNKINQLYLQIILQYREKYPEMEKDFKKILTYMNSRKGEKYLYGMYLQNTNIMDKYQERFNK